MLSIDKAVELNDIDQVLDEILERKKLRHKMVGSLYPNIVADEVGRLVERYAFLGGTNIADDLYRRDQARSAG